MLYKGPTPPSLPACFGCGTHPPTHPHTHSPHTHTHMYYFFLFVGYNSRHQAFGSLSFKKTILTLPPREQELHQLRLVMPGILRVAVEHLAPANPRSSPSLWGGPPGGHPGLRFAPLETHPNQTHHAISTGLGVKHVAGASGSASKQLSVGSYGNLYKYKLVA